MTAGNQPAQRGMIHDTAHGAARRDGEAAAGGDELADGGDVLRRDAGAVVEQRPVHIGDENERCHAVSTSYQNRGPGMPGSIPVRAGPVERRIIRFG